MSVYPIDVPRAIRLYRQLGSWKRVALEMPRPNGTCFQWRSICNAVWRHDKILAASETPPLLALMEAPKRREQGHGQSA